MKFQRKTDTRGWFAPGVSWGAITGVWVIPSVCKELLLGQVRRHHVTHSDTALPPRAAALPVYHHSTTLSEQGSRRHVQCKRAIIPARAAVGSEGTFLLAASWNSRQCCSVHQGNWTRLVLPQIQFKVKCSTHCNYMCISQYVCLEGRCGVLEQGTCHLKTPQCRLWLAPLHSCVKSAPSGFSTQLHGDHTRTTHWSLWKENYEYMKKKKPFITSNYFPQLITFILTLIYNSVPDLQCAKNKEIGVKKR